MAWGAAQRGIDDLVERLLANDASLKSLCLLRTRRVNEEDFAKLCDAITKNTVLVDLNITSHPITPSMAANFATALALNTTLHTLSLGNTSFGDAGLEALSQGIASSTSLQHLDLEHKGITAAGCAHLATAFTNNETNSSIHTLSLSHNAIGNAGLDALHQSINSLPIQHLYLNNCSLESTTALAKILISSTNLKTLHLHNNTQLQGSDIEQFAQQLHTSTSITDLSLSGCTALNAQGIQCIAKNIPLQLQHLDISNTNNAKEQQGFIELGKAFNERCLSLRRLSIASCHIDDDTMSYLLQAINNNTSNNNDNNSVVDVDMSSNTAIGEKTLRALSQCHRLRSITLHNCQLGPHGADILVQELSHLSESASTTTNDNTNNTNNTNTNFPVLQELDISGNSFQSHHLVNILNTFCTTHHAPMLQILVIAANPGSNDDNVIEAVERVNESDHRRELMIVRRSADSGEKK